MQLDICGTYRGEIDLNRVLSALGIDSKSRRQRLIRGDGVYDYLGDKPPNPHWSWFDDEEDNNFDVITWRDIVGSECGGAHIRTWDAEPDARSTGHRYRCSKRAMYILGISVLVVCLKVCQPQVWNISVSPVLKGVTRLRRVADFFGIKAPTGIE